MPTGKYNDTVTWHDMPTACVGLKRQKETVLSQAVHWSPVTSVLLTGSVNMPTEVMNKKAMSIISRVRDKLTGKDFATEDPVDVQRQVELLIQQATSHENLCQCYIGWCPFW
ncbi:hypothetical protein ACOMHN_026136 [Nucella lapillus]